MSKRRAGRASRAPMVSCGKLRLARRPFAPGLRRMTVGLRGTPRLLRNCAPERLQLHRVRPLRIIPRNVIPYVKH